jgi:O-antigen/teichoic acid export membrane protein
MPATVALFLIVMFTGFFAMIFGIVYLGARQNMAMIEKGMNPKESTKKSLPRYLKWAMLFIGAGVGLFLAYMLDTYVINVVTTEIINGNTYHHRQDENPAIYFSLIAIGGGLGLFASYRMERKELSNN